MKIFLTGASGFIGRLLSFQLAELGHQVHALCRNDKHPFLLAHPNIKIFKGDISDKQSIVSAMCGCRYVYHTAALAKMWCSDKSEYHRINVEGTRNVMDAASFLQVEKIIYTSTCGVWGPTVKFPMNEEDPRITGFAIDYERTKYLAEIEVQNFVSKGMNIVTVNPSRVFGEGPITGSNTVGKMINGYLKGRWRIIPGCGNQVANYAYLPDVVQGHLAALDKGVAGERYILGGEDISFNEFFSTLQNFSDKNYRLFHVPQKVIKAFSWVEWLKTGITGYPPIFLPEFADRLKYDQKYSSDKAVRELGYEITPFAQGLEQTINYIKSCQN
jgi:nucleoside-diphosphate-sugar epimerase